MTAIRTGRQVSKSTEMMLSVRHNQLKEELPSQNCFEEK